MTNELSDYSEDLLIHIGYPKTGSTWLQEYIFNSAKFGFCIPWNNSRERAITDFVIQYPYKFSANNVLSKYQDGLRAAHDQNLTAVLSDETLGGDPLRWYINSQFVADRLNVVFPNARILICIREQKKAILSLYSEYLRHSGLAKLKGFIGACDMPLGRAPICDMDQLEYDLLIGYYQEKFGKERVLVLPFELFTSDKRLFLGKILKFLGKDMDMDDAAMLSRVSNPSLGATSLQVRRYLNYVSATPDYTRPKQPLSFRINNKLTDLLGKLTPEVLNDYYKRNMFALISDHVGNRYSDSNLRSENITGLDLREFGYFID